MFFHISNKKLENFPNQVYHKNFVINFDNGWNIKKISSQHLVMYKGYLDEFVLADKLQDIIDQSHPQYYGNFCLLDCTAESITIKTDVLRSFPLWYSQENGLTNLQTLDKILWTDRCVSINKNFELIESIVPLEFFKETEILSLESVVEKVDKILSSKISNFFKHNQLPVKVFLSGGIDTMLLYSYIKRFDIPHELIKCSHIDFDFFYLKNQDKLAKFWGYHQIHHWLQDSLLVSGTPGDEYTVRSPATANLILKFYNLEIPDLFADSTNSLHYEYFNQEKNLKIWEQQKSLKFDTLIEVINYCLNINYNDWQHWHLGNTLTYTPLRDQRLFYYIAMLDKDSLKEQIMNSVVQKELIRKNDENLLQGLSNQKNKLNDMENLTKLFY